MSEALIPMSPAWTLQIDSANSQELQLLQGLAKLVSSVPAKTGVALRPEELPVSDVLNGLIDAMADDQLLKYDPIRAASLLEIARSQHTNATGAGASGRALPVFPRANHLPTNLRDVTPATRSADAAIERALGSLPRNQAADSDAAYIGLLLACLVRRAGIGSESMLVDLLSQNPVLQCSEHWSWLIFSVSGSRTGSPQIRRLIFEPVTAAIWLRCQPALGRSVERLVGKERKAIRSWIRKTIRTSWKSFSAHWPASTVAPAPSIHDFVKQQLDRILLQGSALLRAYVVGSLEASSLSERSWARLIGVARPESVIPSVNDSVLAVDEFAPADNYRVAEQLRSELNQHDPDLVSRIHKYLRYRRGKRDTRLAEDLPPALVPGDLLTAEGLLVTWVRDMLDGKRADGHRLALGTIQGRIGMFGQRWLHHTEGLDLSTITPEELTDVLTEIAGEADNSTHRQRIAAAANHFLRSTAALWPEAVRGVATGAAGGYPVSTEVMFPKEFDAAIALIDSSRSPVSRVELRPKIKLLLLLLYRLGLRIQEALGLKVRDVQISDRSVVVVRPNPWRTLKTRNAQRLALIQGLPTSERGLIGSALNGRSRDELLFSTGEDFSAVSAQLTSNLRAVLRAVVGDESVHPHSLRHGSASFGFFYGVTPDVDLVLRPVLTPGMVSAHATHRDELPLLTGPFRPLSAIPYALQAKHGHGAPDTTIRHYSHLFDLSLYCSLMASDAWGSKKLIGLAFGHSADFRQREQSISGQLMKLALKVGAPINHRAPTEATLEPTAADSGAPSFEELMSIWNERGQLLATDIKAPTPGAEQRCCMNVLDLLSAGLRRDRFATERFLVDWTLGRRKGRHDAFLRPDQIRSLISALFDNEAQVDSWLEVVERLEDSAGRRTHLRLTPGERRTRLRQDGPRLLVRLGDRAQREPRGKGQGRSRQQEAITWTLICVRHWLEMTHLA